MAGPIKRQGPHQVATNSTSTGRSDFKTTSENSSSLISVNPPPQLILNVEQFRNPNFLPRFPIENLTFFQAKEENEERKGEAKLQVVLNECVIGYEILEVEVATEAIVAIVECFEKTSSVIANEEGVFGPHTFSSLSRLKFHDDCTPKNV